MPYEQLCNVQVLMHNNAKTAQIEKKRASNMFSLLRYPMYIGTFWDMNFLEIYVILKQNSKKKHWQLINYAFIYEIRCTAKSIYKIAIS